MLSLARILALIAALCVVGLGLLGGAAGLAVGLLDPSADLLAMTTLSGSLLALTVGLGGAVAWQAGQAIRRRDSARFRPRWAWVLILASVLALIAGQLALSLDLTAVVIFPPFHVAATALPPLAILALAGWALGGASRWREVVLQVGSGAFLSTLLAMILEMGVIFGLLMAVFAVVAAQPGGSDLLLQVAQLLEGAEDVQDLGALAFLARLPVVLAAGLLVVAVAIPWIEESVKTLGVALFAYRKPTLPQAYLWGLAAGAGFALAEAMLNSAGALQGWAVVALMRVGATLVHCFTGAVMGLAWYQLFARQRWGQALGLYGACIGVHALWNFSTTGMALLSLSTLEGKAAEASLLLAGMGAVGVLFFLVFLALAAGLGLVGLTLYIRRRYPPSAALPAVDSEVLLVEEVE